MVLGAPAHVTAVSFPLWTEVLFYLGLVNIGLAVFNLLPIPPLDGSVLVERLLPGPGGPATCGFRPYTMPILLGAGADQLLHAPGAHHLALSTQRLANLLGV